MLINQARTNEKLMLQYFRPADVQGPSPLRRLPSPDLLHVLEDRGREPERRRQLPHLRDANVVRQLGRMANFVWRRRDGRNGQSSTSYLLFPDLRFGLWSCSMLSSALPASSSHAASLLNRVRTSQLEFLYIRYCTNSGNMATAFMTPALGIFFLYSYSSV